MGDNLKIRKLKLDIIKALNDSLLPMEVRRLVLSEIITETNQLAEESIQKEAEELKEKEKKHE